MGAYMQLLTRAIPTLTGLMLSGCYKIPAIQINVTGVFTNKMATDAYRGAGRPEATYVVERALDLVADELGDRKSTRLNSSHSQISYAVFCLKKKKHYTPPRTLLSKC